jgi:hypothetical protein
MPVDISPSLSNEHRRTLISRFLASERSYAPKQPDDPAARAVVAALYWLDDTRTSPPSPDEIAALGTLAAEGDPAIRALEGLLENMTGSCPNGHESAAPRFPTLDALVANVLTRAPRDVAVLVEQVLARSASSPSDTDCSITRDGGQVAIDHLRELTILVEAVRDKLCILEPLGRALACEVDPACPACPACPGCLVQPVLAKLGRKAKACSTQSLPSHSYQVMRSDGSTTTIVADDLQALHKILESQHSKLVIDDVRRVVLRSGVRIIDLQRSHMLRQILILLGSQPNRPVSKEVIAQYGCNLTAYHPLRHDARVHTNVSRLRKLLAASSEETELLQNTADGYCLRVPASFLMIREVLADHEG